MTNIKENSNMVKTQTLYMAILISITVGFMAGAAYTSFKLAGEGNHNPMNQGAAQQQAAVQNKEAGSDDMLAEVGARVMQLEAHLKDFPEDAGAWTELGNLFYDTNRFVDAIEAYKKSLEFSPDNPNVLTDLGVMYRRNGQPEKAVDTFDKVIEINPSFETAYFNKGIVLMHDLNDMEAAVQSWQDLVKINPMATTPGGDLVKDLIPRLQSKQ